MHETQSLSEVNDSIHTRLNRKGWRKILPFLGPAYLVSVGYMDPGNWATDLQGGARFGYQLLWILLMSNLMALLLQSLSARLGIVRRLDLAQANREVYPGVINFSLYLLAELAIAATDLAEVLGMALGLKLLTGLPLVWGVGITVFDTFLLFYLQKKGMRVMEAFIISLVAVIAVSFVIELFLAKPDMVAVATGLIPSSLNEESLYIAVGIIGATVMPHNLYLHSALVQTRKIGKDEKSVRNALKYNFIDSTIALNAAFFVNAAILILAASAFFDSGKSDVAKIEEAHQLLRPLLGSSLAPVLFAIALIASGQSSTVTGTLAGQVVMEGYLHLRINPWLRRLLTRLVAIVPAVIVILFFGEEKVDDLLVFSQVLLSMQLGFAVIPLIIFVSNKEKMGSFVIKWPVIFTAALIAGILVFLNARLVILELIQFFDGYTGIFWKIVISIVAVLFIFLFAAMIIIPFRPIGKRKRAYTMHAEPAMVKITPPTPLKNIAIALDFSSHDENTLKYALLQGDKNTVFTLIHVVETASSTYSKHLADDQETRSDERRLQALASQLSEHGFKVIYCLGYDRRVEEIVRLTKACNAELLVMGSHGHRGLKDFIYGQTVDAVRHRLKNVNVLIVK
jgi:manganese transport protein